MPALDQVALGQSHVVAQIVEAKLIIGAIGDVALVLEATLFRGLAGENAPGGHPQGAEDATHQL